MGTRVISYAQKATGYREEISKLFGITRTREKWQDFLKYLLKQLAEDALQRREELHPLADMVCIYSTMPGESAVDNSGRKEGCFLIRSLDTVLRNSKWRLDTLQTITTRMQGWIKEKAHAKELAHIEHT